MPSSCRLPLGRWKRPSTPSRGISTPGTIILPWCAWRWSTTSSRPSTRSWTGNGRIGRLLISPLLVYWNLLPHPLLDLSAYFGRHRGAYYDHLLAVSQRGAWRQWIRFFLRGVAEQAQDAVARVRRLQELQDRWRRTLTQVRSSSLLLSVADSLFTVPILTIPQVQQRLGVTYHTARRCVERLAEAAILRQMGDWSYGKVFFAPEIMAVVADDGGAAATLHLYF